MRGRRWGDLGAARFALLLALGISLSAPVLVPAVAAEVAAAEPDLAVVTSARYEIQPDRDRIHVVVDATAVNHRTDTATERFYFENAFLAVPPGADGFTATIAGGGTTASVDVQTANRSYQIVSIGFGRRLYGQETLEFRLVFDLPDRGGEATRDVRVGQSLAAFPVWAYATDETPGSRVTIVLPLGWSAELHAGALPPPVFAADGRTVYRTDPLDAPLEFYAYVVADRPGAYVDEVVDLSPGSSPTAQVTVRGWADDPEWTARLVPLVRLGLPALAEQIGLPFRGGPLVVRETVSRTLGGYAGLFDPSAASVDIAYFAGPFVTLHELAHAWFNGRLVADRWISEAFASWYAHRAAVALDIVAPPPLLTLDLQAARIPLNAWQGVGRTDDDREDYAYAATYRLAALIAERAGPEALERVWAAAARGESAYQPLRGGTRSAPHLADGPPDWRGLLDLLEGEAGADFTDLWREWVVRPDDLPLLEARAVARARYADVVAAAAPWELPDAIRDAMAAWQFEAAAGLLDAAAVALERRTEVEAAADAAGLEASRDLQAAFEDARGPASVPALADAQLGAIATIARADEAALRPRGPIDDLGLIGREPGMELDRARTAFAAGDLDTAVALATSARLTWEGAEALGTQRLVLGTLMVGALLVLVGAILLRDGRPPRAIGGGRARFADPAAPAPRRTGSGPRATIRAMEPERAFDPGAAPDPRESAYGLLQRGQELLRGRHYAQAATVLARAARLEPGKGSILEALGRAYYNSGQHEHAAATFEGLLEVDPSAHYAHYAMGQSLKQLGRTKEARTHLRLACALDPTSRLYQAALNRLGPKPESTEGGAET